MQPDVQENAPEGACWSIGVAHAPQLCQTAAENSIAISATTHDAVEIQPDLIKDLPSARPSRKSDPRAKPTWAQWSHWDKYRRLLNDARLVGHDAAFKLWHWLDNSKETNGEVVGFRAQAEWIARKFGWKPSKVYAAQRLLVDCGYLKWHRGQGSQPFCKPLAGIRELPKYPAQGEWPFMFPVESSSATGRLEPAKSACSENAIGPSLPLNELKSASSGSPYSTCDLRVIKDGCVREAEKLSLPLGLPQTEEEAIKDAGTRFTCSDDFIILVWHTAMSRGGSDWKGRPIINWVSHVNRCWLFEQQDWSRHQKYRRLNMAGWSKMTEQQRIQAQIEAKKMKREQQGLQRDVDKPEREQAPKANSTCPDKLGPKPGDPGFGEFVENLGRSQP